MKEKIYTFLIYCDTSQKIQLLKIILDSELMFWCFDKKLKIDGSVKEINIDVFIRFVQFLHNRSMCFSKY